MNSNRWTIKNVIQFPVTVTNYVGNKKACNNLNEVFDFIVYNK